MEGKDTPPKEKIFVTSNGASCYDSEKLSSLCTTNNNVISYKPSPCISVYFRDPEFGSPGRDENLHNTKYFWNYTEVYDWLLTFGEKDLNDLEAKISNPDYNGPDYDYHRHDMFLLQPIATIKLFRKLKI